MQRVAFGRINRRAQGSIQPQPFDAEMRALAESHRTTVEMNGKEWFAAEMTIDDENRFLTGVIGYETTETLIRFSRDEWSWSKGDSRTEEGGLTSTVVPFAVDLRQGRRWVCFAVTQRIQPTTFARAFEGCLNAALRDIGLVSTDWDIDLTFDRSQLDSWLHDHPSVTKLVITIRRTNPGREIDDDRQKMQALAAMGLNKEYTAGRGSLELTNNSTFEREIEGVEIGDLDIRITARTPGNRSGRTSFSSKGRAVEKFVEEYGLDLTLGKQLVQEALEMYSDREHLASVANPSADRLRTSLDDPGPYF